MEAIKKTVINIHHKGEEGGAGVVVKCYIDDVAQPPKTIEGGGHVQVELRKGVNIRLDHNGRSDEQVDVELENTGNPGEGGVSARHWMGGQVVHTHTVLPDQATLLKVRKGGSYLLEHQGDKAETLPGLAEDPLPTEPDAAGTDEGTAQDAAPAPAADAGTGTAS